MPLNVGDVDEIDGDAIECGMSGDRLDHLDHLDS